MIYSVEQIIGLTLFAARDNVKIHRLPFDSSTVDRVLNKGQRVGTVFSWIERNSEIWYQLESGLYVKHEKNKFNLTSLRDQGALSIEEEIRQRERENMNPLQRFIADMGTGLTNAFGPTGNVLKYALPVILLALVAIMLVKLYKTSKIL